MFVLLIVLFFGDTLFDVDSGIANKEWNYENGVHFTLFFNIFVFL